MDVVNDVNVFCFGLQWRGAWSFSMNVEYQVEFLHSVKDGVELFDVLDSVLGIGRHLRKLEGYDFCPGKKLT